MANDLPRMSQQMHENIEGPAADVNGLTASFQLSSRLENAVGSKRDDPVSKFICHFGKLALRVRNGVMQG